MKAKNLNKNNMEIKGKIKLIKETQTFGENGFKKRELVIVTDEQYPQSILIEFVQNKCEILDKFSEGQNVTIGINLRGREWTNKDGEVKYFNSLNGWRITGEKASEPIMRDFSKKETENDLPF